MIRYSYITLIPSTSSLLIRSTGLISQTPLVKMSDFVRSKFGSKLLSCSAWVINRSSRSSYSEISTPAEQTLALQRIMQLLPQVNRDTLFVLLHFLGLVADNSEDKTAFEESEYHLIIYSYASVSVMPGRTENGANFRDLSLSPSVTTTALSREFSNKPLSYLQSDMIFYFPR